MHWGSLGVSGAGLLIVEATAVLPEGRISPQDIGLWSEDTEDAMRDVLDSIRSFSRVPLGIQLAHAGRKASCRSPWMGGGQANAVEGGWRPVAPSALPFAEEDCEPSVLDAQGIRRVVEAFAQSALRARRLGFQAIELHAAHGYLLHQFLSPLSNHRSDAYGGSLENRMRLTLEVFEAMRELLPDRALGVRISATDWVEGGVGSGAVRGPGKGPQSQGRAVTTSMSPAEGSAPFRRFPWGRATRCPLLPASRLRRGFRP